MRIDPENGVCLENQSKRLMVYSKIIKFIQYYTISTVLTKLQ